MQHIKAVVDNVCKIPITSYTSKQMSRTCPIQPSSGSMFRPMKYKAWTEEQMSLAHQAYITDKLGVRRIAEEHGIPKSTLQDRVSGKALHVYICSMFLSTLKL